MDVIPSSTRRIIPQAPHPDSGGQPLPRPVGLRPPKADPRLCERPPGLLLPGWAALLVLAVCACAVLLLPTRTGLLPSAFRSLPVLSELTPAARADRAGALRAAWTTAGLGVLSLFMLAGLMTIGGGEARVLSRWGRYRGTVRRTGLVWVNPLLRRRSIDVRIRHWRSDPVDAVDRGGSPIRVRLLVVWRVRDTARAMLSVADHEQYLREQVHAVLSRVATTAPCDSFEGAGPALRDGQWLGDELTRALIAEAAPVGIEVYSVQPLGLEYGAEVADSMRRRRMAELDADLRTVIVNDAVEAAALTVRRLEWVTARELDETERAALMEQLLVAFVTPAGIPGVGVGVPSSDRAVAQS
jgi:regulator of protease activity HflC (stomatin/prohibitin superfamily)